MIWVLLAGHIHLAFYLPLMSKRLLPQKPFFSFLSPLTCEIEYNTKILASMENHDNIVVSVLFRTFGMQVSVF